MKRVSLLLICLLLVLTLTVTAFAATETVFSMTAPEQSLYPGDTVTISVDLSNDQTATSYGLMLFYDEAVFELSEGNCTVSGSSMTSFNKGFAFLFSKPTAYSGNVGTVTLRIKDTAVPGFYEISGTSSVKNGNRIVTSSGCSVSVQIACNHSGYSWVDAGSNHVMTCGICNETITEAHIWDDGYQSKPATCIAGTETEYTCSVCGITKTETGEKADHIYGQWTTVDDSNHKRSCLVCDNEESSAHSFEEELFIGSTSHYRICQCGQKKDEASHTYDESKWMSDENTHWHICTCGAKSAKLEHSWDGKVCTVCNTENANTSDNDNNSNGSNNDNGGNTGNNSNGGSNLVTNEPIPQTSDLSAVLFLSTVIVFITTISISFFVRKRKATK